MRVASLHVYPVKGLAAVDLPEADVEPRGLAGDRRAMIVDADGTFITQREHPAMATLRAEPRGEGVAVMLPGREPVMATASGARRPVVVWRDPVDAAAVDGDADAALSDWFGRPVHLVLMDRDAHRSASADWVTDSPVSFADGFPVLVVNTASLDDLNARIVSAGTPAMPLARFRPNVVVEMDAAWAEDAVAALDVGEVTFDLVKPCQRCVVTTTDQATGVQTGEEPLRTLTTFRRSADRRAAGVLFGWNAVPRRPGRIHTGDPVSIAEPRERWPVG